MMMEDGSGDKDEERRKETLTRKRTQVIQHTSQRIFFVSPTAIPVNRCLTEWISSVKPRLYTDKLFILNNLSVKPYLFTDKLSILSQPYSVI